MAKVMVSLPDDLLAQIDAEAKRRETTRSGLLAAAVRRELASPSVEARQQAVTRMEARAAKYGWPTDQDLVDAKADRDARDLRR